MKKTKESKKLEEIYLNEGPESKEFYDQLESLIISVQQRYLGRFDEDLHHRIYLKIRNACIESPELHPEIGSLSTWFWHIARNETSLFKYHEGKVDRWSPEPLPYIEDESKNHVDEADEKFRVAEIFQKFRRLSVNVPDGDVFFKFFNSKHVNDNPVMKAFLWELARIESLDY